jgi:predicted esterase
METIDSFELVHAYFMKNYMEGNDLAALEVVNDCLFPPYEAMRLGWKMAILAKLNRVDEALAVFQEALDAGYWYDERALHGDSDFASLKGNPRFDELIQRSNAGKSAEKAAFVMPVFEPISPSRKLLIALHGNASHAEGIIQYWKPATEWGWVVALPQSTQGMWLSGHYAWDNRQETVALVEKAYASLIEKYRPETVVMAGFSRGGETALFHAIEHKLKMALLIDSSFPQTEAEVPVLQANSELRVYITSGTVMMQEAKKALAYLGKQQIQYQFEETENYFHTYPPNFPERIQPLLDSLS